MCYNLNGVELLKQHSDKIVWALKMSLIYCRNTEPTIEHTYDIMKYYKLISDMPTDNDGNNINNKWYIISENIDTPCAIKLLENIYKLDNKTVKIKWDIFSQNPNIFTYDYKTIKETKHDINKEFIEWVWKPENMNKWKEWKLN
jgi:hypothetical protein